MGQFGPTMGERIVEQAIRDAKSGRRWAWVMRIAVVVGIIAAIKYIAT